MKKVLLITSFILIIPIILISIMFYNKAHKTNVIVDNSKEIKLLEEYAIKEKELENIKEANQEKIKKYEKVKSWNEEITYYFD